MKKEIIIDAEGTAVGRIGSFVSKQLLLGNKVLVINAEKSIITGNPKTTLAMFIRRKNLGGTAQKGPYYPMNPERLLKRMIRGMLPWKNSPRGREAFKRLKCYISVPEELKDKKAISFKVPISTKKITLKELTDLIRGSR